MSAEETVKVVNEGEKEETILELANSDIPMHALPLRDYFDSQILPFLAPGLALITKERPENPVSFLAEYLLQQSPSVKAIRQSTEAPVQPSN